MNSFTYVCSGFFFNDKSLKKCVWKKKKHQKDKEEAWKSSKERTEENMTAGRQRDDKQMVEIET